MHEAGQEAGWLMDQMYPNWRTVGTLVNLPAVMARWVEEGVIPRQIEDTTEAMVDRLTRWWEEVYLSVTNETPHKPPLVGAPRMEA